MKLNVLALSALLALAVAETTSSDAATVTLSPEAKCANACKSIMSLSLKLPSSLISLCIGSTTDSCCIAACYNVPCPSDSQANDTNTCVAACPQGNGSAEDSKKYGECEQACFSSHYFPAHGAAATETSSSGTTATGSMATETGSSSSSGCMCQSTCCIQDCQGMLTYFSSLPDRCQ